MQWLMVRHKLADYGVWKPYFDADKPRQEAAGLHLGVLLRSLEDPNDVVIAFQMDDVEKARAFTQDPGLEDVMKKAGVVDQPTFMFLDEIESHKP